MTATLKQINVSYSHDEDRIAVKFLDSNMLEVCAWLTYSVAGVFAAFVNYWACSMALLSPHQAIPSLFRAHSKTLKVAHLQFEKEAAAVASKSTTYLGDQHKSDKGEELLIKEGD